MAIISLPEFDAHSTDSLPVRAPTRLHKVLHLINGEHYSGAERVQDLLGLRLPEFGFAATFACLKPGRFASCRQALQAELIDVPMRSRFDLRPARELAQLVQREGFELVHSHTPRAALLGRLVARQAGVPHVHHVHSPTAADSTRRWQNRLNTIIERWSLRGVAGVIAVSRSMAEYALRQGIDPRRVSVVPNGVPVLGPLPERATPTGEWTLGMVALFRPRKGLEVLLEAMARLQRQGLPVRLRAVGGFETAEYEQQIRATAERLGVAGQIDWVGFTRDVPAELARMDLFVLPSLFGEGLPMVVLEAMAAGVPVVGTRVEGVPEAIRDGVEGMLSTPGDSADLATSIECFVQGDVDWQTLRSAAWQRQRDQFSDQSMARGVAEVYRRVLQLEASE